MSIQNVTTSDNFVPFDRWMGNIYPTLRIYKGIVPCTQAPRKLKDWKNDNCVYGMASDAKCAWTFCTITLDDHVNEAVYFSWTGNYPVSFSGYLSDMELIQFRNNHSDVVSGTSSLSDTPVDSDNGQ